MRTFFIFILSLSLGSQALADRSITSEAGSYNSESTPKSLVCAFRRVYPLIYDYSTSSLVTSYREPWRLLGAAVLPTENVVASSHAMRRKPPTPVSKTTVYYDTRLPNAKSCAEALASEVGAKDWVILPNPALYKNRPLYWNLEIEIWIPTNSQ